MKDLEKMFVKAVNDLLKEDVNEPPETVGEEGAVSQDVIKSSGSGASKIDKYGATGSGNFSAGIINSRGEAMGIGETLAAPSSAKYLMEKMGVGKAAGADDLQRATSIILQAIGKPPMAQAFGKPIFIKEARVVKVPIISEEIDIRNGIAYLHLTLVGAVNAGILNVRGKIKFVNRNENVYGAPAFFAIESK